MSCLFGFLSTESFAPAPLVQKKKKTKNQIYKGPRKSEFYSLFLRGGGGGGELFEFYFDLHYFILLQW